MTNNSSVPAPPVVLLHGTGSTYVHNWASTGWTDLLADAGREVLAAHLPGHGPDPAPPTTDAAGLLLATIGDRPQVDAVGFSAGAMAVLAAAAREPDRFRRVVLIGIGDGAVGLADEDQPAGSDPEVPDPQTAEGVAAALEADSEPEELNGRLFRRLVEGTHNDRFAVAAFVRSPQPRPGPAELAAMTMPVLVLLGDRDFGGPAGRLTAAFPDATLVTVRGADHFSTTSNFSCLDAVLEFLA